MINIKRVGEIIARNRKDLSMTQTQLGEVLKVSHQAVSKWERGACLPDIDILVRLAKIFNNTVDYFLTQEENDAHISKTNILNNKNDIWKSVLEKIKTKSLSQALIGGLQVLQQFKLTTLSLFQVKISLPQTGYIRGTPI